MNRRRSSFLHCVTYTARVPGADYLAERSAQISRRRTLTLRGCERILRKSHPELVSVSRVETLVDER
jgi:hypothetical protein